MSTVDLLRAHAPTAPEELHRRVLALRPEPGRRFRVRPAFVLAGAAALTVSAALVHGFTSSAPTATVVHGAAASGGAATTGAPLQAHIAGKAVAVPIPAPGRLQHVDASLRVRVGDLGVETTRATRIATSLGGWAQSVVSRAPAAGAGTSFLELRIPVARVEQALSELARLGTLVSQRFSVQDLTAQLERQSAQIDALRRRVAALQAALRSASLPEAQRVLLQIRFAESKRALAERLHGRKGTLAAGATARVSVVLTTATHAAAAPHRRGRIGRLLHDAVHFLALEGMIALFALIVSSPLAVAFGLFWFVRRRATERLLME